MFHLPKQYRDTEVLWRRLILFTAGLILIIVYFGDIMRFLAWVLGICSPFFIGALLAFIFNTIASNLMAVWKKLTHQKENRWLWIVMNLLALVLVVGIIALFLFLIIPKAVDSFHRMASTLPSGIQTLYEKALAASARIPYLHTWLEGFSASMDDLPSIISSVSSWILNGGAGDIMGNLYTMVTTTFSWLVTLFLALAFSIILLFNRKTLKKEFSAVLKAYVPQQKSESVLSFLEMTRSTFAHYISGTCTECLILGTLVTVFSLIFRLPYSFLCGIVVAIGALVPMFGALIAAIFMSIFIAVSSPLQGLSFLILFLCIQSVEGNFIYPHVVGKFVEFPPMYVIIAITVGANVAGVLGMIISIPLCSVLYQLIRQNVRTRIASRSFRHS